LSGSFDVALTPGGKVGFCGEWTNLSRITLEAVAFAEAGPLVSDSFPRILLRSANATNMTKARVPVFKCLRNGDNTVTRLAMRL